MRILCFIPARGGSKSIPRKNLAAVAGKPLLAWSIEQARACPTIDRVVVSTDDEDIAAVAERFGAEAPFRRPAELATDAAPTEPAMIHGLDALHALDGYAPEAIVLLQPTCPVRKPGTLARAVELFLAQRADSLVSAREIHPFLWRNPDAPTASYDYRHRPRRQDVSTAERLFEENGSIYITRTELLRETGCRLGGKIALFEMEADESWDIDALGDLVIADALLRDSAKR